jgi:hypothetical protein
VAIVFRWPLLFTLFNIILLPMLKLNKANFFAHLNSSLLQHKFVIASASLKIIDPLHVLMVNILLACEPINDVRINDYSIVASSHKKLGKNNLPLMGCSRHEAVFTISLVYRIQKQYIAFSDIDLPTATLHTHLLHQFKAILPQGWDLMVNYEVL